jgi:hypothetical protein
MERRNILPALTMLTASLTMASIYEQPAQPPAETANCTPDELNPVEGSITDLPYASMREGVQDIKFVADPWELTRENQENYAAFLATKDLSVKEQDTGQDSDGNEWLFNVALVPSSVIRSSGLRHIVVVPSDYDAADYEYSVSENKAAFTEPHHNGDTLWVSSSWELSNGLAAMILDNHCNTQAVLTAFDTYTREAGHTYDPDFNYVFGESVYEEFEQQYGSVFERPEAVLSPRAEFMSLLREFIDGHAFYNDTDHGALSKKRTLVRQVFNDIEANGDAWQQLANFGAAVGTHGLPPLRLLFRIECMNEQLSRAQSEMERNNIIMVDAGEYAPDPDVRDCDTPGKALHLPDILLETTDEKPVPETYINSH